jgi:DUF1680 family protein
MRRYAPVRFNEVDVGGRFWRERLETVLTRTIPSQYRQLAEHGILASLSVPQPPPPLRIPRSRHNFTTQIFWDSDVGKWIEAASYALSHRRDADVEAKVEEIIGWLAAAQLPDGYLNCWYIGREVENRWTNLRDNHELYCAGHMLEGAIAYFLATGRRRLLDIMEKYVDHIATVFGPGPDQKHGYPGHQEIELALIKLYHLTGDRRRLDLASYFINERGKKPHYFDIEAKVRGENPESFWARTYEYNQSHKPVREQDKAVGHAVRAIYMYTAMADLAADLGDDALKRACELLWDDVTARRMYVTGGLGPAAANEGFTTDYDLPNDTAYAETCAAVALIFWAQRMLNLDLDGKYADVLELALYNGALAGRSRDGEHYFYQNPLESDGTHTRWTWHTCPCCTMNVSRLVASVGGYFYSVGADEIAVHLYGGASTSVRLADTLVRIEEESDYPWNGAIRIKVEPDAACEFTLKLRVPGWARRASLAVNGGAVDIATSSNNGYVAIRRTWSKGDLVALDLPMPVERIYAHPEVKADIGRVCLKRGPFVYCAESADNPAAALNLARLPRRSVIEQVERGDVFDGIVALSADGLGACVDDWNGNLYRAAPPLEKPAGWRMIPYFLWNNRGPGAMLVWFPED